MINIKQRDSSGVYAGNVTIRLSNRGKTYKTIRQHNNGTKEFFSYILTCVVAGTIQINKRPAFIDLYSGSASVLSSPVLYSDTSAVEESPTGSTTEYATVTYHFLIPNTIIKATTAVDTLKLISIDGSTVYATVSLDSQFTPNVNTNISVDWELVISDKE